MPSGKSRQELDTAAENIDGVLTQIRSLFARVSNFAEMSLKAQDLAERIHCQTQAVDALRELSAECSQEVPLLEYTTRAMHREFLEVEEQRGALKGHGRIAQINPGRRTLMSIFALVLFAASSLHTQAQDTYPTKPCPSPCLDHRPESTDETFKDGDSVIHETSAKCGSGQL
jgi:hypothetical protein